MYKKIGQFSVCRQFEEDLARIIINILDDHGYIVTEDSMGRYDISVDANVYYGVRMDGANFHPEKY